MISIKRFSYLIRGYWCFYRKMVFPSFVLSIGLALLFDSADFDTHLGIAIIGVNPLLHYFIYEVRNPNEYAFYHNLGLSKMALWIFTCMVSLSIAFLLIAL